MAVITETKRIYRCDRCGKEELAGSGLRHGTTDRPKDWRVVYLGYGEPEDTRSLPNWLCPDCVTKHSRFLGGEELELAP